jgi:hypothetical protein
MNIAKSSPQGVDFDLMFDGIEKVGNQCKREELGFLRTISYYKSGQNSDKRGFLAPSSLGLNSNHVA